MKELKAKIQSLPNNVLILLMGAGTVLISFLLIYFVVIPSFQALPELQNQITTEKQKAAAIDQSISLLQAQDKAVINALTEFLEVYVPESIDNLHFATLNEAVSTAAGVSVSNIQITKGATTTTTQGSSPTAAPATAATGQTSQAAPVSIAVTYTSNFDSLLRLIAYWKLADQLVGIKRLNISGVTGVTLNYTINYDLPTSGVTAVATVEDKLALSVQAREKLEDLKNSIIYTATPSANSVGKSNPFN